MSRWRRLAVAAGTAAAASAYVRWMDRRNASRSRPPLRDRDGVRIPYRSLELSDGATVPFVDVGTGPPMVLVPGADGTVESFRYQIPAFAERHRVVSAGLRADPPPEAGFDLFARDVRRLIQKRGTGPVVLLGTSLGGAIAMRFAARFPGLVRGLVLSNTLARVSYGHLGFNRTALIPVAQATTRYLPEPAARAVARLWCRAETWVFDDSPGRDKLVDHALRSGARTVSSSASSRRVDLLRGEDLRPELEEVDAPTLVVTGERDAYCPPEWSREIAALVPGARYEEVPEAGHCAHISMPGLYNRIVLDWVGERVGGGAGGAKEPEPEETDEPGGSGDRGAGGADETEEEG